jgi:hypothetical protein
VSPGRQLPLFPTGAMRRPVSRMHLVLARRAVRAVRARGPGRQADLAAILACDPADLRVAVGIAVQWRRVDGRDGCLVAVPREGGQPT